jgi:hypothetical protein
VAHPRVEGARHVEDDPGARNARREHLPRAVERAPEEVGHQLVIDPARTGEEVEETGGVARVERRELGQQLAQILAPADLDAIAEREAERGVAGDEIEMVGQPLARRREEVFEQLGQGEDRRAGVEAEAAEFQRAELAARSRAALDDRHRAPGVRQPDRCRQAAEPRADHDDATARGGKGYCHRASLVY